MEEFKPNSNRSKEPMETPKQKRETIHGDAQSAPRNGLVRFADLFLAPDLKDAANYALDQVLKPKLKDILMSVVQAFIYGSGTPMYNKPSDPGHVSYSSYYNREMIANSVQQSVTAAEPRFNPCRLVLNSKDDCTIVISGLNRDIAEYQVATVAALKEILKMKPNQSDYNHGWKNLTYAAPIPLTNGKWLLELSKPLPLE